MEQSELERLRAEKAQMCQQLADATAALDVLTSSVRDLPPLELPVAGAEKLSRQEARSAWTSAHRRQEKRSRR
jgi:hypothetical protein